MKNYINESLKAKTDVDDLFTNQEFMTYAKYIR
jgi:hypothetical protein